MSTPVEIKSSETDVRALVSSFGQLVVAPYDYSTPVTRIMNATGTAFNFVTPRAGSDIVVTDMVFSADKNVSNTTPADIQVFTANSASSITPIETLLRPQMLRSSNLTVTGLNMRVGPGLWINAITDDDIVFLTLMYYYIPRPASG